VQHLVGIIHKQWVYRNACIHLKSVEGRTTADHRVILEEVRNMMGVDPSNLLSCHRHLLEQDWEQMGSTTTTARLEWLERVDSALAAKRATLTTTIGGGLLGRDQLPEGVDPQHLSNLSKRQKPPRQWLPTVATNR
jgi:hypothetical protein